MPMVPFYTRFRDLAFREMRSIILLEDRNGLPAGSYGFLESYCDEPGCDCRTVFINVVRPDMQPGDEPLATINYGWEDLAHYTKWIHGDEAVAREMKGPGLAVMQPQSRLAPALLEAFKEVLNDGAYVERLQRHYTMFRMAVEGESGTCRPRVGGGAPPRGPSRNDYCPCGSGKKYKHCCGAWAETGGGAVQAGTSSIDAQVRERLKDLRLPRHAESPPSAFLAALLAGLPQAGAALARLAAFDAEETVVSDAQTLLFTAFRDHGVADPLRERLIGTAVPVLRAALKDAGLSDDRKYELGPLIAAAGFELPRREYEACFRDFAGTVVRKTAEALKSLPAAAREVEGALRAHGLMKDDEPVRPGVDDFRHVFAYGAGFAELNPAAGGLFLATAAAIAAEHGKAPLDAQAALLRVRETGTPLAAWCLAELGAWPALGVLGEKACELAEAMRAEGVRPSRPHLQDFSHGIISNVDGLGSRNLLLFFRTPTGALDGLVFMPNDEVGIKSVFCAYGQGAEIEPKLRERPGVMFASASMVLARELLGEALAVHAEQDIPPPGRLLLFRHLLSEDPVVPKRRRPNLGAYALELLPRNPSLADGSDRLCDDPLWEEFWFACDAAFQFVRKNRLQARGEEPPRFVPAVVERFAREMEPQERKHLISRMEVCLETAVWAGRATEPMFRLAARTWVVLSEGLQPFHEVPYVRALARRGLEHVSINVAMGFRNQREVNETRPD